MKGDSGLIKSNIKLPYGKNMIELDLQNHNVIDVLKSGNGKAESVRLCEEDIVKKALETPVGKPRLREIIKPGESACIVISDITRAWQRMNIFLPELVRTLNEAGVSDQQITFVCAVGSHRKITEEEGKALLGEKLSSRFKVINHDCHDSENLKFLGTTSFGTKVHVNRLVMENDHIILTGGIVFHDLAGWGGGKKSILPGICGYETIMENHALSLGDNPGDGIHECVRCGSIDGNRLNADMEEAAKMVNPSFMLNVIVNSEGKIGAAVAGDYLKAFEEGKRKLDETDRIPIDSLADMVVVSVGGYPKDINLYQSTKALSSAKEAVKKGKIILLLCQCSEGVGHPEVKSLLENFDTHMEREMEMRKAFTVSKFAGFLLSQIAEDYQVYCVTDLEPEILEKLGIQVFQRVEDALKAINKKHGVNLETYIIPSGSNVLPGIRGDKI
ncbi:MAG: nickel-dependent lactate racemase [Tindallia sp. MSAO_Bac2]|nr:MAG: nickel-dependent lactate racemase [Tindallia sp. MSAO_Bac2]